MKLTIALRRSINSMNHRRTNVPAKGKRLEWLAKKEQADWTTLAQSSVKKPNNQSYAHASNES